MIGFLLETFKNKFGVLPKQQDYSSILVIRNDHIGDLVLSLPVLHAIRRAWPKAKTNILVSEYAADIVKVSEDIDKVFVQQKSMTNQDVASLINKEKIDLVLNFNATKKNAQLVRMLKAKVKIGYAYKPYNMISHNRFVFTHRSHPPIHETVFMLEFLKAAGIKVKFNQSPLPLMFLIGAGQKDHVSAVLTMGLLSVDEKAKKSVALYLRRKSAGKKKIIAIHCGDNRSADNWSCTKYIRFAGDMAKKLGKRFDVFLILGPSEKSYIDEAKTVSKNTGLKLVEADLSLRELIAFIDRVELLVAGSTGPLHIAGALNKKVIGLFPTHKSQSKEKWGPLSSHAVILESKEGISVENGITEKSVEASIRKTI